MKKILVILIMMTASVAGAQSFGGRNAGDVSGNSSGLCYMMTSYEQGSSQFTAPLFNVGIFNQPCFYIEYANYKIGFQFLFDLAVGISIALAIIPFTIGAARGVLETLDIGGASALTKVESKERMTNAIIGLMVVLSVWMLVNTVNPDLLRLPIFNNAEVLSKPSNPGTGSSGVTGRSGA